MNKILSYSITAVLISLTLYTLRNSNPEADAMTSYEAYLDGEAVFIDVREEKEVKEGIIKGALWIPLSKIKKDKKTAIENIKKLSDGKEIFLYCKSGNRSGKVKKILNAEGIKSVNMGGFKSLKDEKLPTQQGS